MPSHNMKRVIVIGAGSIGCATAWHLRNRGLEVILLDAANGPATQASGASAGFVAHWSTHFIQSWGAVEWAMQDYGIRFYTDLAQRHEADIGFKQCGIAYIYLSEDVWGHVQDPIADAQKQGTSLEILSPDRCNEVLPGIHPDRVAGIVYEADAIRVRSADAISALARDLERAGVEIKYGTPVTELMSKDGVVTGVVTPGGSIDADQVVVAAGVWTRPFVDAVDVRCPADPLVEMRFTTKPIAGVAPDMPLLIFPDCCGFYMREERGGLLIGGTDPGELHADRRVDPLDPPQGGDIRSGQVYRVRECIREIEDVMPVLRQAEIDQIDGGLPTFTSDTRFIVDEIPTHRGAYFVSGCNEGGITHGPALGKLVTELAVDGSSQWDRFRSDRLSEVGESDH